MAPKTSSALENTLRHLVAPVWHSQLSHQELEDGKKKAKSIICFIGLIDLNPNDSHVAVNMMGSLLKDALLFLHQGHNVKVLRTLFDIMDMISAPSVRRNLQLEDIDLEVSVMNSRGFLITAVTAVKHSLMLIKDVKAATPVLWSLLLVITESISLNTNSHENVFAETALSILKRSSDVIPCAQSQGFKQKLLSVASSCINLLPYSGSVKHYMEISNILITSLPGEEKLEIFRQLFNSCEWSNHDCIVMAAVIKSCDDRSLIADQLVSLSIRICNMVPQKDLFVGALKLLQTVTECLTVNQWADQFMAPLLAAIPTDKNDYTFYMDKVLLKFVTIAVGCYGAAAYKLVRESDVDPVYCVLCLMCSIQHDVIDIESYKNDLCKLIELGANLKIANEHLINILFVPRKKRVLNQWQLRMIMFFLDNSSLLESRASTSSDLHYLLSHLYITGNDIILDKEVEPLTKHSIIKSYGIFLKNLYEHCINTILSGSKTGISHSVETLQLFHSVVTQFNLKTKYNFTKTKYAPTEAPFLKWLIRSRLCNFWSKAGALELCKFYINEPKHYPEILSLVLQWYEIYCPIDKHEIEKVLEAGFLLLETGRNYDAIEKGCQCGSIFIRKATQCSELRREVIRLTESEFMSLNVEVSDPLLDYSMLGLVKAGYTVLKLCGSSEDSAFQKIVLEKCMEIIQKMLDLYTLSDQDDTSFKGLSKDWKISEHIMIVCLDTILLISNMCLEQNYETIAADVLKTSYNIIEMSNMKKLVSEAVGTIRKLCTTVVALRNDRSQAVIIKFLEHVLCSIYRLPDKLNRKIRRSPQHRLAIYSIVIADKEENNVFLGYAIHFLLEVLSDPASSSNAIASALHTMEILISDTRLKKGTFQHISSIAVHAIDAFSRDDYEIRNAAAQVIESLTNRLLGQQNYLGRRRNCIEDALTFIPDLTRSFYSKLHGSDIHTPHTNAVAILSIFSASHRSSRMYLTIDLNVITESFSTMFIGMMYSNLSSFGAFSANAFAAVCPHIHIPFLICDIVRWLKESFCTLKRNIFNTFMHLLQALYEKFTGCTYVNYYKLGLDVIKSAFRCLARFFKQFNVYEFLPFTALSICSCSDAEGAILNQLKKNSFMSRLWLDTNIPFILTNVSIHRCTYLLQLLLRNGCSLHSEFECLRVVVRRYEELISHSLVNELLLVILDSFLKVTTDCKNIIHTYSDIIYLLVVGSKFVMPEDLLFRLRSKYKEIDMSNFSMVSSYIICLSTVHMYADADHMFIQKAIRTYQKAAAVGVEVDFHTAATLKFLYKCVKESERHHIFKMAFMLLMEDQTSASICTFVANTFKVSRTNDEVETLHNLLSHENLTKQLGSERKAMEFLVDLTRFVSSLEEAYEDCGNFYLTRKPNICSHKNYLMHFLSKKVMQSMLMRLKLKD